MYICKRLAGIARLRHYHPMIQMMDYTLSIRINIIKHLIEGTHFKHLSTKCIRSYGTEKNTK